MKKYCLKIVSCAMVVLLLLLMGGCNQLPVQKYSNSFFDCFDTVITVYGYAESQTEFDAFSALIHDRFISLHQQFDAFHEYEGVQNLYTINKNAGNEPVAVSSELFDLIEKSIEFYRQTGGKVNIAMGSVLNVWSEYRELATQNPNFAVLPQSDELSAAAQYMDINDVVLERDELTVYLADASMSLNVGAVAKGYACQLIKEELTTKGYDNFVINAGGNVVVQGEDIAKSQPWRIGIQNPDTNSDESVIDTVEVTDLSVVTAGSYQRYFTVDGERYHHIIDPATLMPSMNFDSVTVICKDSMLADFMATTLFILPASQGMSLAESLEGLEVVWIDKDGTVTYTSGYAQYSMSY